MRERSVRLRRYTGLCSFLPGTRQRLHLVVAFGFDVRSACLGVRGGLERGCDAVAQDAQGFGNGAAGQRTRLQFQYLLRLEFSFYTRQLSLLRVLRAIKLHVVVNCNGPSFDHQ